MSSLPEPYTPESDAATCPRCGEEAVWEDCYDCNGQGFEGFGYTVEEKAPIIKEECETCKGDGGRYRCPLGCEVEDPK